MLATTVIQESNTIHWEAVAITAVPAFLAMFGSVVTALLGRRNKKHLQSIDNAVNGVEPGKPTMRENVEAIAQNTGTDIK